MKKFILFLITAMFAICANAQNIQKGYHGFAELGYNKCISQLDPSTIEITTSHGYQFNPYIFLGAGVGFDFIGNCQWGEIGGYAYEKRDSKVDIPVFFNVHSNFTRTKFSPFLDVKVGAYVNNDHNKYAKVSLGCRYALGNNMGLSLSVGYKYRDATIQHLEISPERYSISYYYRDETGRTLDGISIDLGFDF